MADCVLNEVTVPEQLRAHPHPNLVSYCGCVVKDGLFTHISLQRYPFNLVKHAQAELSEIQRRSIFNGIKEGVEHLHSLDWRTMTSIPTMFVLIQKDEPSSSTSTVVCPLEIDS